MKKYEKRIITMMVKPDKIGDVIGPKGKTIRGIQDQTGAKINIDDSGLITIAAVGHEAGEKARSMIASMVAEPEVGRTYEGPVKSTTAFGAFVEIMPGVEGLLHISELQQGRVNKTTDVVKEGDQVKVKVIGFDDRGKVKLSMRVVDQPTGADITDQVGAKPGRGDREKTEGDGEGRLRGRGARDAGGAPGGGGPGGRRPVAQRPGPPSR